MLPISFSCFLLGFFIWSSRPLSVVNRFQQTVQGYREAMTGSPCAALWWSARPSSVLNRFEQSVHWAFIAETTTNSLPGDEASQVKAKLNFPGPFYVFTSHIHAQMWPLKGKCPTSSYTSYNAIPEYGWKKATFKRVLRKGNNLP